MEKRNNLAEKEKKNLWKYLIIEKLIFPSVSHKKKDVIFFLDKQELFMLITRKRHGHKQTSVIFFFGLREIKSLQENID